MENNTVNPAALAQTTGQAWRGQDNMVDRGVGPSALAGGSAPRPGSASIGAGPQVSPANASVRKGESEDTGAIEEEDEGGGSGHAHGSRRRTISNADDDRARAPLACFYCRTKRIRCSGERPTCMGCIKAKQVCEYPSGRKKKRTRKEMEQSKQSKASIRPQPKVEDTGQAGPSKPTRKTSPTPVPQTMSEGKVTPGDYGADINSQIDGSGMTGYTPGGSMGFDSLFNMDTNESYSGDQSNNTFQPPTFWTFPSASSSNPNLNSQPDFSSIAQSGPSSSTYVWPTGFTPELTLPPFPPSLSSDLNPGEPTMAQFMNTSPATDMRLINALENQAAYIEGNPDEDKDLELFYYRFAGSTAIQPGIHRISLKLQRRSITGESPLTAAPQPERDTLKSPSISLPGPGPADIFDDDGMPRLPIWQNLFELFLANMSQHFPSVSRQRMTERFETGTMSNFLANCICACGARFSSDAKDRQAEASAPFIAKAQELLIPLLHLPTTETTTALIFLAWANFGQNSESGLWQYSGMAIRMAIDIGIHENSDLYESPTHVVRTRLLFWTLFVTDRVVAFATGRPASISEDIIEVPLPEDEDFFPDPARNTAGFPLEAVEPVPFVYFVRLMIICGRISNVLNGRRGRARTLVATTEPLTEQLSELQSRLVHFVANLPESLRWSADNFRHQHTRGHGGCFLAIHLWSHAVLALIYHPELLKSPSGVETPLNKGMSRNVKLSLASSRQICECMVFADLVAPSSYTSTPFLVQPLFVAAMAIIHEMRAVQTGNASDMFLVSMGRQNLTALLNAISRMEQYWAGAGYVATILEKRSGVKATSHSNRKTLISLPDHGLLKRFTTDKDDPRDLAPATETSLRESIAKSERNNASPYWLADLMAGYTVENMSYAPADSLDLERLLSGGGNFGGFGQGGFPAGPSGGSNMDSGQGRG